MQHRSLFAGHWLAAVVLSVACGFSTPAAAQGFLEGLFGMFAPQPNPRPPAGIGRPHGDFGSARSNPFDVRRPAPSRFGGGRYRTMCVRLCDGYYFPISNAVTRRDFYGDAGVCQSRCDTETQLFYMPTAAGSIDEARSLTGLAYKDLTNAFRYRKALDKSCTCRPEPWSAVERARHQRYAMIEAGTLDAAPARLAETEREAGDPTGSRPEDPRSLTGAPAFAAVRPGPVRPPPAFGLGGPSRRGGQAATKRVRKKPSFRSHWPGLDGN